jgi:electron transfer flavoprotein alpha subunit
MPPIFAYIVHKNGVADDTAAELPVAACKIDPGQTSTAPCTAIVTGWGADLERVCESLRTSYREIWKVAKEPLAYPNAELVRKALLSVVPAGSVLLVPHAHFGVDLSPGLSVKMNAAYLPDVLDIEGVEGKWLKAVRQEFGGQVSTHVRCDLSTGAVLNIRPGAFRPSEGAVNEAGQVIDKSAEVGALTSGRRYLETIETEAGDVDITKQAVLVSIGRGIGEQENVEIAEELAEAMGAAVSCSRPVVDAKWMDKSRQVGSSGQTVRPKVYLACGISGSFQHLAGLKGSPFIVAINKNPKAPIFRVADIGVIDDMLEFLPELTKRVREECSVPGKKGGGHD